METLNAFAILEDNILQISNFRIIKCYKRNERDVTLSDVAQILGLEISTVLDFLNSKNIFINSDPNSLVLPSYCDLLDKAIKNNKTLAIDKPKLDEKSKSVVKKLSGPVTLGKIELPKEQKKHPIKCIKQESSKVSQSFGEIIPSNEKNIIYFEYNINGVLLEQKSLFNGHVSREKKFDKNGNKTEEKDYSEAGKLMYHRLYKFSEIENENGEFDLEEQITINSEGNLEEVTLNSYSDSLEQSKTFCGNGDKLYSYKKFDLSQNCIERGEFLPDERNKGKTILRFREEYEHNEKNELTSILRYKGNELECSTRIKYNEDGEIISYEKLLPSGRALSLRKIEFSGNKKHISIYDHNQCLSTTCSVTLDHMKRITSEKEWRHRLGKEFRYHHRYKYWENGKKSAWIIYFESGAVEEIRKYNEQGMEYEQTYFNEDGVIESKHIKKYEDNGDLISDIDYDADGRITNSIEYKRKFDHKNNWIEQIEFTNGIATYLTRKEISYF